jgi:DNA-binding CsgD family transcriptional regulator
VEKVRTLQKSISSLYRTNDLAGVLAAAEDLFKQGRVWCLTWPREADRQIMVTTQASEPVDLLIASQVERAPLQGPHSFSEWSKRVARLLSGQFPWLAETTAFGLANHGTVPVGLVGTAGSNAIQGLSEEVARAIERVAILQAAVQEGALFRHLLASCGEALLAINEKGRILAGTESGRRLLRIALHGSPRSPFKALEDALPAHILSPILLGDTTCSYKINISATPFREIGNSGLIEPLILVSLRSVEPTGSAISPERLARLTPTQKEVFECLVAGDRNKGIAARLGMSVFTARNHVSVILSTLGCSDRLELIARFRRFNPASEETKKPLVLPPLLEVPAVPDLALPVPSKRV